MNPAPVTPSLVERCASSWGWRWGVACLLAALAWLGNFMKVELAYGVHFIFGSVAVMWAVVLLGRGPAVWVALVGGLCTWQLWGHPWASLVGVLEAWVVGTLLRRGWRHAVLADACFWTLLGAWIIVYCYQEVLGMAATPAQLVALKQGINAVFNALLAGAVVLALQLRWPGHLFAVSTRPRMVDILFHTLLSCILLAGAAPLIHTSQSQRGGQERLLALVMQEQAQRLEVLLSVQDEDRLTREMRLAGLSGLAIQSSDGQWKAGYSVMHSAAYSGEVLPLAGGLSIWVPEGKGSVMQRWRGGYYQLEWPLANGDRLLLERPAAPLIREVEQLNLAVFGWLALGCWLGVGVAYWASLWLLRPLSALTVASRGMGQAIASEQTTTLPLSEVQEYRDLGVTLQDMGQRLVQLFRALRESQWGLEQQVHERTAALHEQVQQTQAIVDNMADGIITLDEVGHIRSFNAAAERIFGYAASEVMGRNVGVLMPGAQRAEHDQFLRTHQRSGVPKVVGGGAEVQGLRKDGSVFPLEVVVSTVTQQGVHRFVGLVRDISERKRDEQLKNEFVSAVSHELRTPLTAISGALGLLGSGVMGGMPAEAQRLVDIASKNSKRLTFLINDLLDFEKLRVGKMRLDMREQALEPLLQFSMESVKAAWEFKPGVVLRYEPQGDTPLRAVYVDAQRLEQVMANLLSNAVKFSPESGEVRVRVQANAQTVRVSVCDQGPGVSEAFQPRLFERFAQADTTDARKKGGTGLGLAISKELIVRMGGRIGYEPGPQGGACFFFELPFARAPKTTAGETPP